MSSSNICSSDDFSADEFRRCLGMFPTGVTLVTALGAAGERLALTVSSFNSVSLEPPLVLWSLNRHASTLAGFRACSHYAILVLGADQRELAERFAGRGEQRWHGLALSQGLGQAPLIADCIASFECRNRSQYDEGDHVIFVGEVQRCCRRHAGAPLLYHGGQFYAEHPLQSR